MEEKETEFEQYYGYNPFTALQLQGNIIITDMKVPKELRNYN